MDIQEVRLLIKQIGKELYEDNPERQARGPFSVDKYDGPMTREQKLADVEAYQAEMLEKQAYRDALMDLEDSLVEASPSVGEKLIANFINFYPMGKRGSAGIGSLLGKEIGGMSEAEALRIKDIEQKIYELNSVYQKEGRGLKEIEALEGEKQGIMSILSETPLSDEPIFSPDENQYQPSPRDEADQAAALIKQKELDESAGTFLNRIEQEMDSSYDEFLGPDETPTTGEADPIVEDIEKGLDDAYRYWQAGVDEDSSLYDALENYKNLDPEGQEQVKDMLREDMFERLGLEDARAEVKFFSDSGAFDAELVDQYLNKELAGAYPKIFGKPRSYKAGGLIMNYGDYGRNYK